MAKKKTEPKPSPEKYESKLSVNATFDQLISMSVNVKKEEPKK